MPKIIRKTLAEIVARPITSGLLAQLSALDQRGTRSDQELQSAIRGIALASLARIRARAAATGVDKMTPRQLTAEIKAARKVRRGSAQAEAAKTVKTERDYRAALAHVARLMEQPASNDAELERWSLLVANYEEIHFPIAKPKALPEVDALAGSLGRGRAPVTIEKMKAGAKSAIARAGAMPGTLRSTIAHKTAPRKSVGLQVG